MKSICRSRWFQTLQTVKKTSLPVFISLLVKKLFHDSIKGSDSESEGMFCIQRAEITDMTAQFVFEPRETLISDVCAES